MTPNLSLIKHLYDVNKKITQGLQKHGAPKEDKGYIRVKTKNLRELAHVIRNKES